MMVPIRTPARSVLGAGSIHPDSALRQRVHARLCVYGVHLLAVDELGRLQRELWWRRAAGHPESERPCLLRPGRAHAAVQPASVRMSTAHVYCR